MISRLLSILFILLVLPSCDSTEPKEKTYWCEEMETYQPYKSIPLTPIIRKKEGLKFKPKIFRKINLKPKKK